MMREYLKKNPREQYVALRIAEIYEKDLGNHVAASMEYEEILKKRLPAERWGWAAIHLCNIYAKMGQQEKVGALLEKIARDYPKPAPAEKRAAPSACPNRRKRPPPSKNRPKRSANKTPNKALFSIWTRPSPPPRNKPPRRRRKPVPRRRPTRRPSRACRPASGPRSNSLSGAQSRPQARRARARTFPPQRQLSRRCHAGLFPHNPSWRQVRPAWRAPPRNNSSNAQRAPSSSRRNPGRRRAGGLKVIRRHRGRGHQFEQLNGEVFVGVRLGFLRGAAVHDQAHDFFALGFFVAKNLDGVAVALAHFLRRRSRARRPSRRGCAVRARQRSGRRLR